MSVTDPATAAGAAGLAIAGILALFNCVCTKPEPPPEEDIVKDAELDAVLDASEQAAKDAADRMAADAAVRDELTTSLLSAEEKQLAAAAQKIKDEMAATDKQWQDAQQGLDPKDPGYDAFKKQYDDYQDYLKTQMEGVNSKMAEIQTARLQEEAAQAARNDWVKQRQEDLVQTAEQKSYLEAVAKGYGAQKGYNIDEVNARLKQLNEREAELKGVLKANNADIEYTPQQRDPIGPDADSIRLNEEYREKQKALQDQIAKEQGERNASRRADLEKEQAWLEKDMKNRAAQAGVWNFVTKTTQGVQVMADTGVDILSNLTGPVGKTVKTLYTGAKGVAGGFGEGLASGEMSKNLLKGAVGGLSDVVKDKVGDNFGNAAKGIFTVGSESAKGALEAGLDGKDVLDGAIGGGLKGTLDEGTGPSSTIWYPPGKCPKGSTGVV